MTPEPPSQDRIRWGELAHRLTFQQLDVAREQAQAWRAGLAGLTALLTAIFVLKGRDNVSALDQPYRTLVVVLLGAALLFLLCATMLVSRAIAGPPGEEIPLTPEGLEYWTRGEVRKISRAMRWAPWLAAAGVVAVASAVGVTWLAPAQNTDNPLVRVEDRDGQACGEFIGVSQHQFILRGTEGNMLIPLSAVVSVTPVGTCGSS